MDDPARSLPPGDMEAAGSSSPQDAGSLRSAAGIDLEQLIEDTAWQLHKLHSSGKAGVKQYEQIYVSLGMRPQGWQEIASVVASQRNSMWVRAQALSFLGLECREPYPKHVTCHCGCIFTSVMTLVQHLKDNQMSPPGRHITQSGRYAVIPNPKIKTHTTTPLATSTPKSSRESQHGAELRPRRIPVGLKGPAVCTPRKRRPVTPPSSCHCCQDTEDVHVSKARRKITPSPTKPSPDNVDIRSKLRTRTKPEKVISPTSAQSRLKDDDNCVMSKKPTLSVNGQRAAASQKLCWKEKNTSPPSKLTNMGTKKGLKPRLSSAPQNVPRKTSSDNPKKHVKKVIPTLPITSERSVPKVSGKENRVSPSPSQKPSAKAAPLPSCGKPGVFLPPQHPLCTCIPKPEYRAAVWSPTGLWVRYLPPPHLMPGPPMEGWRLGSPVMGSVSSPCGSHIEWECGSTTSSSTVSDSYCYELEDMEIMWRRSSFHDVISDAPIKDSSKPLVITPSTFYPPQPVSREANSPGVEVWKVDVEPAHFSLPNSTIPASPAPIAVADRSPQAPRVVAAHVSPSVTMSPAPDKQQALLSQSTEEFSIRGAEALQHSHNQSSAQHTTDFSILQGLAVTASETPEQTAPLNLSHARNLSGVGPSPESRLVIAEPLPSPRAPATVASSEPQPSTSSEPSSQGSSAASQLQIHASTKVPVVETAMSVTASCASPASSSSACPQSDCSTSRDIIKPITASSGSQEKIAQTETTHRHGEVSKKHLPEHHPGKKCSPNRLKRHLKVDQQRRGEGKTPRSKTEEKTNLPTKKSHRGRGRPRLEKEKTSHSTSLAKCRQLDTAYGKVNFHVVDDGSHKNAKQVVACPYCQKKGRLYQSTSQESLSLHIKMTHKNRCFTCKMDFESETESFAHRLIHTKHCHRCMLCDQDFRTGSQFLRHQKSKRHLLLERVQQQAIKSFCELQGINRKRDTSPGGQDSKAASLESPMKASVPDPGSQLISRERSLGSSSPSSLSLVDDDSLQPEDGPLDDAQQRRQLDHFFEENPQYADLASKLVKTTYHPSRVLVQAAEEQLLNNPDVPHNPSSQQESSSCANINHAVGSALDVLNQLPFGLPQNDVWPKPSVPSQTSCGSSGHLPQMTWVSGGTLTTLPPSCQPSSTPAAMHPPATSPAPPSASSSNTSLYSDTGLQERLTSLSDNGAAMGSVASGSGPHLGPLNGSQIQQQLELDDLLEELKSAVGLRAMADMTDSQPGASQKLPLLDMPTFESLCELGPEGGHKTGEPTRNTAVPGPSVWPAMRLATSTQSAPQHTADDRALLDSLASGLEDFRGDFTMKTNPGAVCCTTTSNSDTSQSTTSVTQQPVLSHGTQTHIPAGNIAPILSAPHASGEPPPTGPGPGQHNARPAVSAHGPSDLLPVRPVASEEVRAAICRKIQSEKRKRTLEPSLSVAASRLPKKRRYLSDEPTSGGETSSAQDGEDSPAQVTHSSTASTQQTASRSVPGQAAIPPATITSTGLATELSHSNMPYSQSGPSAPSCRPDTTAPGLQPSPTEGSWSAQQVTSVEANPGKPTANPVQAELCSQVNPADEDGSVTPHTIPGKVVAYSPKSRNIQPDDDPVALGPETLSLSSDSECDRIVSFLEEVEEEEAAEPVKVAENRSVDTEAAVGMDKGDTMASCEEPEDVTIRSSPGLNAGSPKHAITAAITEHEKPADLEEPATHQQPAPDQVEFAPTALGPWGPGPQGPNAVDVNSTAGSNSGTNPASGKPYSRHLVTSNSREPRPGLQSDPVRSSLYDAIPTQAMVTPVWEHSDTHGDTSSPPAVSEVISEPVCTGASSSAVEPSSECVVPVSELDTFATPIYEPQHEDVGTQDVVIVKVSECDNECAETQNAVSVPGSQLEDECAVKQNAMSVPEPQLKNVCAGSRYAVSSPESELDYEWAGTPDECEPRNECAWIQLGNESEDVLEAAPVTEPGEEHDDDPKEASVLESGCGNGNNLDTADNECGDVLEAAPVTEPDEEHDDDPKEASVLESGCGAGNNIDTADNECGDVLEAAPVTEPGEEHDDDPKEASVLESGCGAGNNIDTAYNECGDVLEAAPVTEPGEEHDDDPKEASVLESGCGAGNNIDTADNKCGDVLEAAPVTEPGEEHDDDPKEASVLGSGCGAGNNIDTADNECGDALLAEPVSTLSSDYRGHLVDASKPSTQCGSTSELTPVPEVDDECRGILQSTVDSKTDSDEDCPAEAFTTTDNKLGPIVVAGSGSESGSEWDNWQLVLSPVSGDSTVELASSCKHRGATEANLMSKTDVNSGDSLEVHSSPQMDEHSGRQHVSCLESHHQERSPTNTISVSTADGKHEGTLDETFPPDPDAERGDNMEVVSRSKQGSDSERILQALSASEQEATSASKADEEHGGTREPLSVIASVDLPPTEPSIDPLPKEPSADLTLMKPSAELPPMEPSADLPPMEPSAELPHTEPSADLPPMEPPAELPPAEPSADLLPMKSSAALPPTEPFANLSPMEPSADLPSAEPSADMDLLPAESAVLLPPMEPPADLTPMEPSADLSPKETFADLSPTEPSADLPPKEPSADLPPAQPSANLPVTEPSPDLSPTEPSADMSPMEPSTDLPPTEPSIDLLPTQSSVELLPTESSADLSPMEPSADLSPTESSAGLSPRESSADLPPMEPSADLAPIEPSADLPLTEFSADLPTMEPSADMSPTEPSADLPPTESSAEPPPTGPSADQSPTELSGDLLPMEPSPDLSRTEPSANPSPTEPSADLPPMESSADLSPLETFTDLLPMEPSADLSPKEPSGDLSPTEHSADLLPMEPTANPSPTEPSAVLSPTEPAADLPPTEPSADQPLVEPSPDLSPMEPSPDLSPTEPSPDQSPTEPSPDLSPTEPSPDLSPTEPSPDLSPTEPSPDLSPTEPSPDLSPSEPSPDLSPTDPSTALLPTERSADLSPSEPSTDLPPMEPSADLPPMEPSADLPPTEPSTDLLPTERSADLPPTEPSTDLPPMEPSTYLPPMEPSSDLPPMEPSTDVSITEPFADLSPTEPSPAPDIFPHLCLQPFLAAPSPRMDTSRSSDLTSPPAGNQAGQTVSNSVRSPQSSGANVDKSSATNFAAGKTISDNFPESLPPTLAEQLAVSVCNPRQPRPGYPNSARALFSRPRGLPHAGDPMVPYQLQSPFHAALLGRPWAPLPWWCLPPHLAYPGVNHPAARVRMADMVRQRLVNSNHVDPTPSTSREETSTSSDTSPLSNQNASSDVPFPLPATVPEGFPPFLPTLPGPTWPPAASLPAMYPHLMNLGYNARLLGYNPLWGPYWPTGDFDETSVITGDTPDDDQ